MALPTDPKRSYQQYIVDKHNSFGGYTIGSYLDWVLQFTIGTYVPSLLAFPQVYDVPSATLYPVTLIPLYVKEHPVPVRKPKVTEINTMPMMDPSSQFETSVNVLFFGVPEVLQVAISGWMITPMTTTTDPANGGTAYQWNPTHDGTSTGTSLGLPGVNYGDLICAYLEGRMSRNAEGRWFRQDPVLYIDPYGRAYPKAIISTFEPGLGVVAKKQDFSMTLFLETGA